MTATRDDVTAVPVRVLLIEDNPADADLIHEILDEATVRTLPAPPLFELVHAGRLALGEEWLATQDIDVVLLDLSLPDSQGFETFRRLSTRFPQVPIVVLSGLQDEALAAQAVRAGAQDYLVKGAVDFEVLARTLRYALGRKQAEAERTRLMRERAEIDAALRARDEFLVTISHDLKSPLTLIKGQAQLLNRRIDAGRALDLEDLRAQLNRIEATSVQMTHMIDELLDVTQLEAGRPVELRREPTDLVALAAHAVNERRQRDKGQRFHFRSTQPELIGVWDPRRLERVLANLLDNAEKYSPADGEIVVAVSLEPAEDSERGDWARLSVKDQGIGIPAAELPRVFERFFRASNVAGSLPGTGIGLAGARQIVEQHGGTITVDSQQGSGTTFIVWLPLDELPSPD